MQLEQAQALEVHGFGIGLGDLTFEGFSGIKEVSEENGKHLSSVAFGLEMRDT